MTYGGLNMIYLNKRTSVLLLKGTVYSQFLGHFVRGKYFKKLKFRRHCAFIYPILKQDEELSKNLSKKVVGPNRIQTYIHYPPVSLRKSI